MRSCQKTNSGACFWLALCLATSAHAADSDAVAAARRERAKLIEKSLEQLTDKTLSQRAQLALDAEKVKWRHGETEHFVYHFQRLTEAQKLAREAEFYYWKIKDDLVVTNDFLEGKSHVIMFARPDQWRVFAADAGVPQWLVGFASGRELFMLIEPGAAEASDRLAHEMTHLVFFRFVPKRVPLWLNEGFAEYESRAAYAKLKGIGLKQSNHGRAAAMSVERLTALETYPSDPFEVAQFYRESKRLVDFLMMRHSKTEFVPFVNLLADGADFEAALLKTYPAKYRKLDDFIRQFDRFQ